MEDLKDIAAKEALRFIKEKGKDWITKCGDVYDPFFYTSHSTTGYQMALYVKYNQNPNKGSKLLCIGRALSQSWKHDHQWGGTTDDKVRMLERVLRRIEWKPIKKIIRKKKWDETQVMKELLARGFVWAAPIQGCWTTLAPGYSLRGKYFDDPEDAIKYNRIWGIPGVTITNTPS